MVPRAFHNGACSRQTHRKALACDTVEIGFARSRSVKRRIAGNDVFLRFAVKVVSRLHDDAAARKPFADIVVGVAFEHHRHAGYRKGPERLTGRPFKRQVHRIVGQPLCAVQINDCVRNLRAYRTVDIAYGVGFANSLTLPDVPINFRKNLCVQTLFEIMLLGQTMAPFLRTALRPVQHSAKIDALSLPVVNVVSLLQKVTASD